MLDFSKIEAGAIQIERAPFNVRRCVQDALDIVALDAREKQLPLISHVSPDVPEWAIGDSGRLSQILINLLANAVKFTETGQVTLVTEAGPAGPYLTELRFAVTDTGIGISDADQAALFEAFVQVDERRRGGHRARARDLRPAGRGARRARSASRAPSARARPSPSPCPPASSTPPPRAPTPSARLRRPAPPRRTRRCAS